MKLATTLLLALAAAALAQPITVVWDRTTAAEGNSIGNYVLRVSKKGDTKYTLFYATNNGTVLTFKLDFPVSYTYQATLYAIDSDGLESAYSDPIRFKWDATRKLWVDLK